MSTFEAEHTPPHVAERIDSLLARIPTRLYINGTWQNSSTQATFAVENPATEETLAQVADATSDDALFALTAAHTAAPEWAQTSPNTRADLLRDLYDAVLENLEDLALIMTLEMGKSLAESRTEVTYAANFLRWFSEEAVRLRGEYRPSPDGTRKILVSQRPVGPSLLITPWNFPLAMATRKIAPALAAGCTTILKPAQLTPLTALLFTQLVADVGVPGGVVNVVPTSSASHVSSPLLADSRLRKLSFTGSTAVGRNLLAESAPQVLRTSMELGGNAPFLVFSDANISDAVTGAMQAKFRNIGQACTAANRFYVHESVVDEFVSELIAAVRELEVGDGVHPDVDLGPLISDDARQDVDSLVQDALSHGAELLTGGHMVAGDGHFYTPTVLRGASSESKIHSTEIFGPVVSITTFRDDHEAITLANSSEYGLAAYAYTSDVVRSLQLVDDLQFGLIGINAGVISDASAPFGGVKQSGLGREGAAQGIEEYLETVYAGIGGF